MCGTDSCSDQSLCTYVTRGPSCAGRAPPLKLEPIYDNSCGEFNTNENPSHNFSDLLSCFCVSLIAIAVIYCLSSLTGGPRAGEFLCHTLEQRHVVPDVLQLRKNRGKWRGLWHPRWRRAGKSLLCWRGNSAFTIFFSSKASFKSLVIISDDLRFICLPKLLVISRHGR